jgi:hypothetical protein
MIGSITFSWLSWCFSASSKSIPRLSCEKRKAVETRRKNIKENMYLILCIREEVNWHKTKKSIEERTKTHELFTIINKAFLKRKPVLQGTRA